MRREVLKPWFNAASSNAGRQNIIRVFFDSHVAAGLPISIWFVEVEELRDQLIDYPENLSDEIVKRLPATRSASLLSLEAFRETTTFNVCYCVNQ
jgi:hypothetical protein